MHKRSKSNNCILQKEKSTCADLDPINHLLHSLPSQEPLNRLLFRFFSSTFLNKYSRVALKDYFRLLLSGLISSTRLHRPINGSFCQHKAQTRNLIVLLMCYFLSALRNGACWLTLEEKLGSERSRFHLARKRTTQFQRPGMEEMDFTKTSKGKLTHLRAAEQLCFLCIGSTF